MTTRAVRPAVLAVDGGNSKTDVALVAADGRVLGTARGPGSNPQTIGVTAALRVIGDLADQAAAKAGLPAGGPYAEHAAVYLAGLDLPVEERRMDQAVAATGWARGHQTGNDTFALLRAGARAAEAVAVVCGAGINCVGVTADGRTSRFPSLGFVSGDWGGGVQLGREALWYAVRGEDGRGEPTALTAAVARHFGYERVADAVEALHLAGAAEQRVGELTPLLFAVAAAGDPVACAVVDRLADEIRALVVVSLRRLGLLEEPVDVVLGGGVLRARHPRLEAAVAARLAQAAPKAVIRVVTEPPVLGAALLGLDRLAGGRTAPEVEARLRAAFR